MLDKLNKIWIGLLFGIFFPAFWFFCYWLFGHNDLKFPVEFIAFLMMRNMIQEVTILCVVTNLLVFYLLLNRKIYDLAKGIIYTTFLYVGLVLYVSLL